MLEGPDRTRRVTVDDGVMLAVHEWSGPGHPFVLLHGLASNARLWDGVAEVLVGRGHHVVAVDQRGHGRADKPRTGYDLVTITDDLRVLLVALDLVEPVVVGQSWGANVAVEFAARFPGVAAAIGCVDGGTIDLSRQFPDWEACAEALRPPRLAGTPLAEIETGIRGMHPDWPETGIRGTLACFEVREDGTVAPWLDLGRHLQVLRGLWDHHPAARFPHVTEPVLFIPARGAVDDLHTAKERSLVEAAGLIADARVEWVDGDHDLHAQHPAMVGTLLETLAPAP